MNGHPLDAVADVLGGEDRVVLAWLGTACVAILLDPAPSGEAGIGSLVAFVILVAGAIALSHHNRDRSRREGAVADAQARYVDGEIGIEAFEREVELALDDRATEIRDAIEDVNGVGPATSANVALQYRTLTQVRRASPEALQDVHGVGPETADAIAAHFGGRSP